MLIIFLLRQKISEVYNSMIKLTKLNEIEFYLNCDLIETIEATPDSVISTTNGKKLVVRESIEEIIESVISYKNKIFRFDGIGSKK